MYLGPIDEDTATSAFPQSREKSDGLFAWGFPRLKTQRLALAWYEHFCLFAFFPLAAIVYSEGSPAYAALGALTLTAAALLSATRNFHWRDLGPNDLFSEWRVMIGMSVFFIALAFGASFVFAPLLEIRPAFTTALGMAILIAGPTELAYRALFFRRYGHLFEGECWATMIGALSTGLLYTMISGALEGLLFGGIFGTALSIVYLRTGSFPLSVGLHIIALLALQLLAPGIGV
ncbi:MAG: type II CAAX prenyl endopeptidase Rce1 family protein [Pikeienuella sp.]